MFFVGGESMLADKMRPHLMYCSFIECIFSGCPHQNVCFTRSLLIISHASAYILPYHLASVAPSTLKKHACPPSPQCAAPIPLQPCLSLSRPAAATMCLCLRQALMQRSQPLCSSRSRTPAPPLTPTSKYVISLPYNHAVIAINNQYW